MGTGMSGRASNYEILYLIISLASGSGGTNLVDTYKACPPCHSRIRPFFEDFGTLTPLVSLHTTALDRAPN